MSTHPENIVILYEDDDLYVIDKPAGIHSVMLEGGGISIAELLLEQNPALAKISKNPNDAGLVQRLDLDTSGCLLAAKNKNTWEKLFLMLKNGEIKKSYLAVVEGIFAEPQVVESFIAPRSRHSKKVQVLRKEKPRSLSAYSEFFPKEINQEQQISLVEGHAPTARRHQIRAHLAYLGFPLVGDVLYGSKRTLPNDFKRSFFLHAATLSFKHPTLETELLISSSFENFSWD
jgi:23S rRNA pseudouridine1911/1915/1917 synthase